LLDDHFAQICINEESLFNKYSDNLSYFILVNVIRTLLPPGTPRLSVEIKLLKVIRSKCSEYEKALNIYQQSQSLLMNHFFSETHSTLPNKLRALKAAFGYAIKEWLCRGNRDFREILRIAQAFLYANSTNLNNNIRGLDPAMPEFEWLREEIDKILLNPPAVYNDDEVNKIIEHLFSLLSSQRNLVVPFYAQVEMLTKESKKEVVALREQVQDLRSDNTALRTQMSELEKKLEMLMQVVATKTEAAAAKDEGEAKTPLRLFGSATTSGIQ
jgi:regulator of replication initiation timing